MKIIVIAILVFVFIQFLYLRFSAIDSTDASRWDRSGLKVYTDSKTGVQYLGTGGGFFSSDSLTPRINSGGKPFIEGAE